MIFLTLFLTFFKIGLFTFGGGYAMLPLIQEEVIAHEWMSMEQLVNFVAVSESTPGPFAINIATYVGTETGGLLGAFCATLGVVMPSFTVILIVAQFYEKFKESKTVKRCMYGLKAAVIGLIASAAVSMGKTVFIPEGFGNIELVPLAISAVIFLAMTVLAFKKTHPIIIVLISAVAGLLAGYLGGISV